MKKQSLRNKIYAGAAALGLAAYVTGKISKEEADSFLGMVDAFLDEAGPLVTTAATIVAFWKTLLSKTTVIDVPAKSVESVVLKDGQEYQPKHRA